MIITLLKKRRGHLNEIQFDDGTYILLDRTLCEENALKEGGFISEEKAEQLENESDEKRCKSRAMYYLSCGDHSSRAMTEKLKRAGFCEPFISKTVARLKELGLIDDIKYAYRFAERCIELNMSNREISEKAYLKGADISAVKEALEQGGFKDEVQRIKALLVSRYISKLADDEQAQKVIATLLRKGFSFSDIKTAVKEIQEEENNEL